MPRKISKISKENIHDQLTSGQGRARQVKDAAWGRGINERGDAAS